MRKESGKIFILRWQYEGVLFGPQWECITSFDNVGDNLESCKTIIRLMNECDRNSKDHNENDKN